MNTIIALSILSVLILFLGIYKIHTWMLPVLVIGLAVGLWFEFADWGHPTNFFHDMFITNHYTISFSGLMIICTLIISLMSVQYYENETRSMEGIYSILLFSLLGAIIMISAGNLASFFIGIELMSVSLYLLAGSHKTSFLSNEAAMKYFLMGSFATSFLLFGITLLYGASGSLNYSEIFLYINTNESNLPLVLKAGIILVAIGLAFKVAAVPFHFWAPDVYHGSPTIITTYMITTVKVAGFAALLRLTLYCFGSGTVLWSQTLAVISALSIVIGNLGALTQNRMKRMLAYSSIAHTGYIMIALVSLQANTPSILFYYSVAYIASNLAIFTVLIAIKKTIKNSGLDAFNGLGKLNPLAAICTAIAFLSLTGIPPLAGFMAKYIVFNTAINEGFLWLVIIALLGSVVSIFYYFRPIINMYMKEKEYEQLKTTRLTVVIMVILTISTIIMGLIPGHLISFM